MLCLMFSSVPAALASSVNYDYIEIQKAAMPTKIDKCHSTPFSVRLTDSGIELKSAAGQLVVHNELGDEPVDAIVGDFWGNRQCFIALKTAESDVNESYDIYMVSPSSAPSKVPGIPSIMNPDFIGGIVISNYRDAARWHKEKLCYPQGELPYLCEKRDSLDDSVESVRKCTANGDCIATRLVFSASEMAVNAYVTNVKATIWQVSSGGGFAPLRSYLIKGDKVRLLDFKSTRGATYYQFEYRGKKTTVGWVDEKDVKLTK
ncbi:SH3-like domain-containing protein [Stenotrophomonas sp. MMGLT7]|uniref:SH3-like domain-containing protein n=1 Tax=Stenotrophomonas sp. MMGLT7 TaxID=2901227 RepID=UPI001E2AD2E2|nr:SH3-like domain-containing protein [Stenotrophomonas sp. MMGLT7]MCD7099392.1 GW dipeptide domain-containing protein [Stenotrophomonas sp. MMGLT7]